jgi:hypothetical protein
VATITDKKIIRDIIQGDGVYPGDERNASGLVVRIVRYTDNGSREVFGIVYAIEADMHLFKYDNTTEYINSPQVVWQHSRYNYTDDENVDI